jgi:hypothetical protein
MPVVSYVIRCNLVQLIALFLGDRAVLHEEPPETGRDRFEVHSLDYTQAVVANRPGT